MPAKPMGEAWFMGERSLYTDLLDKDASRWSQEVIESAMNSLASGPGCFGPRQEWTDWLHYLTPKLLPRIEDWRWAGLYESLVTAFMAQYPDERMDYPYDSFLEDTLATLGRIPMASANWTEEQIAENGVVPPILLTPNGPFLSCGGAMSAALFLHLKYLDEQVIPAWLASVLAIKDPVWRSKLVMWVAQSKALLLESGKQPLDLKYETDGGSGWYDCWCLRGSNPAPQVDPSQVTLAFLNGARQQRFHDEFRCVMSCAALGDLDREVAALEEAQPEVCGIRVLLDQASGEVIRDYQLS